MSKWFRRQQYQKVFRFLGPNVTLLLLSGIFVGAALYAAELAFAYGLQAFLVNIGVMSPQTVTLPPWLPLHNLNWVLGFILAVGVFRGLLQWAQLYTQGAANDELCIQQRSRLLTWALQSEATSTSEVTALFNERVHQSARAVLSLQTLLVQMSTALLLATSLFILLPFISCVTFAAMAFLTYGLRWVDKRISKSAEGTVREWDKTNKRMIMSIKNLLLMQIYGTQKSEDEKAQASLQAYRKHILSYHVLGGFKYALTQILGVVLIALITLLAKRDDSITPGVLISYFYLLIRCLQNFSQSTLSVASLIQSWPHLVILAKWWADKSFDGIRNQKKQLITASRSDSPKDALGWSLKDVTFKYPESPAPLFDRFNYEIEPGKTVVITGPSGAGKSTLINLLIGGLRPEYGDIQTVLKTGQKFRVEEFRPKLLPTLGYVGPESFLFEGTILDNLYYGLNERVDRVQLEDALSKAECQFVFQLPNQLDHVITEQGQGLSAGQKQRLSLARALLRNPKVLILDEATSNLDFETESRLIETFSKLKKQMTIIAVTHRPTLLQIADQHMKLQ